MADQKISQLTDGTSFQAGDEAVVNRSGTNFKVDPTQFGSSIDVTGTVTADGADLDGAVVINESGADVDFRVESDTVTNALFVRGSDGFIGIGTSSPAKTLHVEGQILSLISGGTPALFLNNGVTQLNINNSSGSMVFQGDGSTERMRIDQSGNVGIGTSSPTAKLEVKGSSDNNFTSGLKITRSDNTGQYGTITNDGGLNITCSETIFSTPVIKFNNSTDGSTLTERMRIDSSGNLLVGTATSPSDTGTIVADGIYLGGTGAANLLDDYEEGTWTPTYEAMTTDFSAITYDPLTAGRYTKIGNKVFIEGVIRTDSVTIGSAAGLVYIQGLPFTVNGTNPNAAVLISVAGNFAGDMPSSGQCIGGTNGIELRYRTVANGATLTNDPADFDTGANTNLLAFSAHYTV